MTRTLSGESKKSRSPSPSILVERPKSVLKRNNSSDSDTEKPKSLKRRRISFDQTVVVVGGDDEEIEDKDDLDVVNSSQSEEETTQANPTTNSQSLRKNLLKTQFRKRYLTPQNSNEFDVADSPGSPIRGVSPNNTHNFKMSFENLQEAKALQNVSFAPVVVGT